MGKGKAIASMVCGILAVVLWPISIVLGVIALIFGIIVIRRKQEGRGMAITGVVTGSVGILISVLLALTILAEIEEDSMREAAQDRQLQVCDESRDVCLDNCAEKLLFKDACRADCYDEHTRCINS